MDKKQKLTEINNLKKPNQNQINNNQTQVQENQEGFLKCPYNKNHKIAINKFAFHLHKCKDGLKKRNQFSVCQYNSKHIYLNSQIQTHEKSCPEGKQINKIVNSLYNIQKDNVQKKLLQKQNLKQNKEDIKYIKIQVTDKKQLQQKKRDKKNQSDYEDNQNIIQVLSDCQECKLALKIYEQQNEEILNQKIGKRFLNNNKLTKYLKKYERLKQQQKNLNNQQCRLKNKPINKKQKKSYQQSSIIQVEKIN